MLSDCGGGISALVGLKKRDCFAVFKRDKTIPPAGLEPATPCLEGRCSIRLSYEGGWRSCSCMIPMGRGPRASCVQFSLPRRDRQSVEFPTDMVGPGSVLAATTKRGIVPFAAGGI
jgi:hypothetical protein